MTIGRLWWSVSVALAILAATGVLMGTGQGVGATPDSATYSSVGENLAAGDGLTTYDGSELTLFPPGFPAVLALGDLIGLDPPQSGRLLNLVSLVVVVLLSALILRRAIAGPWLGLAGVALVAVSPVLLLVAAMLWGEIPFIAVTLAFLLTLWRALEDRHGYALVIGAAALAGAGFLLRYPGLVLIGFGAAALALPAVRKRSGRDLARLGAFLLVALVPVMVWLGHNLSHGTVLSSLAGSPLEDRTQGALDLGENLRRLLETIGSWLAPGGGLAALAVVVVGGIGLVWWGRRHDGEATGVSGGWLLSLFSLSYVAFVLLGASVTKVDALDDRLLSPVYVPLLVLLLIGIERVLAIVGDDRRLLAWGLAGVLAVWSLYPISTWLDRVDRASEGVGFATAAWQESETIATLRSLPADGPLYSNWPDGTYYVGGLQPAAFGPTAETLADFTAAVGCSGEVRFAQFAYDRPLLLHPDELGPGVEVGVVHEAADGVVYRVTPTSGTGSDC